MFYKKVGKISSTTRPRIWLLCMCQSYLYTGVILETSLLQIRTIITQLR